MPLSCVVIHRRPILSVNAANTEVPDVVGAEGTYGFGKGIAEATFTVTRLPSWLAARQRVVISCGATDATTAIRFKGEIVDFPAYAAAPRSVQVVCRGHLVRGERILVPEDTPDTDVPGLDLSNMTQVQQLEAIFNQVGLNGFYAPALLGGPPHIMGTVASSKAGAKLANVWKRNQSALSRAQSLDHIGLGFRLVEGPLPGGDFGIYRPQISPRPGPANITLNEGIDIGRDSTAAHNDALDVFNRVVATGGDFGEGAVRAEETAPHPNPDPLVPYQTAPIYSSPLIEQVEPAGYANGISAREIALWQIVEVCQIILKAEISTPRSDLFRLEQSIQLNMFDRFEISQPLWLRQVSWSMKAGQVFRQKLSLRAPAAVGVGGVLLPQERRAPGTIYFAMPTYGSLRAA
jgi:hypothetical protein